MVSDPPNRHYGAILTSLLQERNRYHRPTWIYTPHPIASPTFQGLYGAAAVLDAPELELLHVTPTERSQDPGRPQSRTQVPPLTTTSLNPSRAGPRTALHRDKAKGTPKSKNCKRAVAWRDIPSRQAQLTTARPEETRGRS
jgi:hypothetical protein